MLISVTLTDFQLLLSHSTLTNRIHLHRFSLHFECYGGLIVKIQLACDYIEYGISKYIGISYSQCG